MQQWTGTMIKDSLEGDTWVKHISMRKKWAMWCYQSGFSPYMPAKAVQMSMYAAWLYMGCGHKPGSTLGYLDAVKFLHKQNGWPDPWQDYPWLKIRILGGLNKLVKQQKKDKVKVTASLMQYMIKKVGWADSRQVLAWAVSVVLYFMSLRIGNLLPPSSRTSSAKKHVIKRKHVKIQQNIAVVTVPSTKTSGTPATHTVPCMALGKNRDPLWALTYLLSLKGTQEGNLAGDLSRSEFEHLVRTWLEHSNIPAHKLSAVSFRKGSQQELKNAGVSRDAIRRQAVHRSMQSQNAYVDDDDATRMANLHVLAHAFRQQ